MFTSNTTTIWKFPKSWGYPNSWMVYKRKCGSKIDDLGVPPFMKSSILLLTVRLTESRQRVSQALINALKLIRLGHSWPHRRNGETKMDDKTPETHGWLERKKIGDSRWVCHSAHISNISLLTFCWVHISACCQVALGRSNQESHSTGPFLAFLARIHGWIEGDHVRRRSCQLGVEICWGSVACEIV